MAICSPSSPATDPNSSHRHGYILALSPIPRRLPDSERREYRTHCASSSHGSIHSCPCSAESRSYACLHTCAGLLRMMGERAPSLRPVPPPLRYDRACQCGDDREGSCPLREPRHKDLHKSSSALFAPILGIFYRLQGFRFHPARGPFRASPSPRCGEEHWAIGLDGEYRGETALSHEGIGGTRPFPGEHQRAANTILMGIPTEPRHKHVVVFLDRRSSAALPPLRPIALR